MNKKISVKKIFLLSTCLALISACNEYEKIVGPALKAKLEDKNSNVVFDGEVEPSIPDSYENDKTVLGIDTNRNGIRDDIDIWINRTAINYNERMAMRQYARASQFRLKVCTEDLRDSVMKAEDEALNAGSCLAALTDYRWGQFYYFEKLITKLTLNINRRTCDSFYNQYSMVVTISNVSAPHLNCKFNIENIEEVIKKYKAARRILK